jgi:hypothetical protein
MGPWSWSSGKKRDLQEIRSLLASFYDTYIQYSYTTRWQGWNVLNEFAASRRAEATRKGYPIPDRLS